MSGQEADGRRPEAQDQSSETRDRRDVGCCSVGRHSLTDGEVASDVDALATLGNDTRYEALRLIAEADEDLCVCELEPALGVSQSAVSQALSRLFSAGLVERRKEGRWRYYTATPRAQRLIDVLDETRGETDD
ncbi:ArsR/SmtB family transcription factor [Halorussus sp. AFM4]|uniref:ArsR/SmtB family transcription factor n=1 Tax=Halorussus sp. AFM4 TaxID=3421651 RepID=UPI003EB89FE3